MISSRAAHVACLAFVGLDILARAWRIAWLVRGTGHRLSFGQAVAVNALGDAACALTPMRIGGEPVRLWGMLRAGVPASAAFVAISVEVLAVWPVVLVAATALTLLYAPTWAGAALPRLQHAAGRAWPWIVVVVAASAVAWWVGRRGSRHIAASWLARPIKRVRVYWRRMPAWPVLASIPLTMVNLVCRTGILVALALADHAGMAPGPLFFASFVLLYAQLILPTPSGAGVVDLGVLGGAAGDVGASALLWWRFYSSGVGVLLGGLVLLGTWVLKGPAGHVRFPWPHRKEPTAS